MKKRNKGILCLTALLLCSAPLVLSGCNGNGGGNGGGSGGNTDVDKKVSSFTISLSSTKPISIGQNVNIITKVTPSDAKGTFAYKVKEGSETIVSVDTNGKITGLAAGEGTVIITCLNGIDGLAPQEVKVQVLAAAENAIGAFNYVASSYEDKLEILGQLESYAIKQHLTGLTLFENGGYIMYNERIQFPTNQYISGYGFGILSEGSIKKDAPLKSPVAPGKEYYYHTFGGATNSKDFNYLNDTGSLSSDLYGYISSSYYGTKMNSSKDGYEWYPLLAKQAAPSITFKDDNSETKTLTLTETQRNRPIALNKDEATNLATKYKVFVNTGKDNLKYTTLSKKYAKYNGQGVKLEDYVTPYRLLLTQGIGLARSTDMISETSDGTLKGAKAYYNQTKDVGNIENSAELFDQLVGIQTDESDSSITFTFNSPLSEFEAMTALSSTLTSPIPKEFVKDIAQGLSGVTEDNVYKKGMTEAYGTSGNNGTSPVDNLLSLAPYTLESCEDKYITYKKNNSWFEREKYPNRYTIDGIAIVYDSASQSDVNATWKLFNYKKGTPNNGAIDSVSLGKNQINDFKDDPLTKISQGDSTFKLNLNTCTQEEWDAIFGPNGTNPNGEATAYQCKPLMSNDNFIDALSFAINRETYASVRGVKPSQSYFAPAYLWEPEKGYSYNDTAQHKAAIAEYSPDSYGYNNDFAVQLMDKAIEEEIEEKGNYNGSYNSTEKIQIKWMNPTDPEEYGDELVEYFNKVFQQTEAYKTKGFRLEFENIKGSTDYQKVYEEMRKGTFDLAFGSVSGMTLDPLGFVEVLKSNNVTGFTTNYSGDTATFNENDPDSYITYDNKKWSFDSLWQAANTGAIIGEDKKVVKDPLKIEHAGDDNVKFDFGNGEEAARVIALEYAKDIQAASIGMKLRNSEAESIIVSISYKVTGSNGKETTKTASYQVDFGKEVVTSGLSEDGTLSSKNGTIDIYIPKIITPKNTNNQVAETIDITNKDKLVSVTFSINYYMEINGITSTTTLSVEARNIN